MKPKTPKGWKSTKECKWLVFNQINRNITAYFVSADEDRSGYRWKWHITFRGATIESDGYYWYEDEAANAAYRFAYRYLRPRRKRSGHERAND